MASKLKLEEQSALYELATMPGFPILLKQLDLLIGAEEQNLLAIDLRPGRESELAYAKVRCEGMRRLRHGLAKVVAELRKKAL
jgi:hypothetical protein